MILDYGINKNINITLYKKFGLNIRKYPLKNKKKKQIKNTFNFKLYGKFLKQKEKNNINFLKQNKTFKGLRHKNKYPTRGQRTHTNAKTIRKI